MDAQKNQSWHDIADGSWVRAKCVSMYLGEDICCDGCGCVCSDVQVKVIKRDYLGFYLGRWVRGFCNICSEMLMERSLEPGGHERYVLPKEEK